MAFGDFVRVARPLNAALAAWAVLIGAAVAMPLWGFEDVAWLSVAGAMASAVLILAFGNVLNDITDREVDKTAHPERPLPRGAMTFSMAAAFATLLGNLGFALALLAGGWALGAFALANGLLLFAYNLRLKATPVVGNLVVAWLVASAFLFGALAVQGWSQHRAWGSLFGFALTAFLATFARENAKGLQDAAHDVDRLTLARLSPATARLVVLLSTAAACLFAAWMVLPVEQPWWLARPWTWDGVGAGMLRLGLLDRHLDFWRVGVALSILPFGVGAVRVWWSPVAAQRWLKGGMLVAMLGYSWGALLAWQAN